MTNSICLILISFISLSLCSQQVIIEGDGTLNPKSKLHVTSGDVYFDDIAQGVLLKSPNGQCWRFRPDNNGVLNGSLITCPN